MRFFSGSIVGDVLADPKHSLRSRGQLSSCMAYTLRRSVRRLTTTEKSLFLEAPFIRSGIRSPGDFANFAKFPAHLLPRRAAIQAAEYLPKYGDKKQDIWVC